MNYETSCARLVVGMFLGLTRIFVKIAICGFNGDLAAVRHGIAGIESKIEKRVLELVGVGMSSPQLAGKRGFQRHRFALGPAQKLARSADELVRIDGFGGKRLLA